jgi:hypothetical protein
MTKYRVSLGMSLLVAGVVAPRAGQAQDDQIVQQQLLQQQQTQQQVQLQQQQIQQNTEQQLLQQQSAANQSTVVIPEHLQAGNQRFDASVTGFQAYLDSIKASDPGLYGQLAPDAARLESREDGAKVVLGGGIAVGLISMIYSVASRNSCAQPPITDPNFAADSAAWGACNQGNVERLAAFGFLGIGAMIAGGLIAYASWPTHQELVDLVNKNNRLSKQPLQWQLGYDPAQRFAFGGATVSF